LAIEECQEQINSARPAAPDATFMWVICFIFFAILLFPSIIFPLLAKWKDVAPYIQGIDVSKLEAVVTNSSMHILFYAIPAAIVVTHAIDASAWKSSITEVTRLRLHKLTLLRLAAVLESEEIKSHPHFPKWLISGAFESLDNSKHNSNKEESTRETGIPSLDLVLRVVDKLENKVSQPEKSSANG
jgi:hypothetical protein